MVASHTGPMPVAGIHSHRAELIDGDVLLYQTVYLHGLVAGYGRELVQKLVDADAYAHEVIKGFHSYTCSAEYRRAVLNLGVDRNGRKVTHIRCCCDYEKIKIKAYRDYTKRTKRND